MIPLKLELKNFLSYGSDIEVVDFKDYPLICLTGKNGHGKSALLDAITWAIWGQARKVSGNAKADAGLLRLGQTSMMVTLKFKFNDRIYRTRREFYKAHGKSVTSLDFEIYDKNVSRFVSLTDKTIKATQNKIEELIGLDFDTFVNTAFLRQGNSNEFSKKTPKERKEILGVILGLSKFDVLKQKALEKTRKYQDELKLLKTLQERVREDLDLEDEKQKKIIENKKLLGEYVNKIKTHQKTFNHLEKEKIKITTTKDKLDILNKDISELQPSHSSQLDDLLALRGEWRQIHLATLNSPNIAFLEKQKKELEKEDKDYRDQQREFLEIKEKILKEKEIFQKREQGLKILLEKDLISERTKLEKELFNKKNLTLILEHNEKAKKELSKQIDSLKKELLELTKSLVGNDKVKTVFETKNAQFEKRRSFYQVLIQRGNWLKSALSDLEHKKVMASDRDKPACSLCEQVLTVRRKQFLSQKFQKQELLFKAQLKGVSGLLSKLKGLLIKDHDEIKKLAVDNEQLQNFLNKQKDKEVFLKELKERFREVEKTILDGSYQVKTIDAKIETLSKDLKAQESNLVNVISLDVNLKLIKSNIEVLSKDAQRYDQIQHNKCMKSLQDLERQLDSLSNLSEKKKLLGSHLLRIKTLITGLKVIKNKINLAFDNKKQLKEILLGEKDLEQRLQDYANKQQDLFEEKEAVISTLGSLDNEIRRIDKVKKESHERQKKVSSLEIEVEEYNHLANIFGRDGIQALLIEEAIPEIEEEANFILTKLTDNNSQIMIDSLRDLKKGGIKETLDIKVSDSYGIRPYEMFSGGEAFRIDFALRIAISKLLARRAGTALQTLIIDEGFGSQDEEGLARLMDAIVTISDSFSRIIIVSHLAAFKGNFPVHFQVDKLASGSKLSVALRG